MILAGLAFLWAPVLGTMYADGPPPAHTGGFGEPTCRECHFDGEVNAPGGTLAIEGVPEIYIAGERYVVTVTLSRPEMQRGGFQLAARFADGEREGRQAGSLRALSDRAGVTSGPDNEVLYAQHTEPGTALVSPDTARWTVEWTPPESGEGSVVFHIAANTANGDDSAFGDLIYLRSIQTRVETNE